MRTAKFLSLLALAGVLFVSCSDDDDPDPVNEEEVITTMTVTLVPQGGGTSITLLSRDLDGDGPNPPEVSVSSPLAANTSYDGTIVLLNETETPSTIRLPSSLRPPPIPISIVPVIRLGLSLSSLLVMPV